MEVTLEQRETDFTTLDYTEIYLIEESKDLCAKVGKI